MAKYITKDSKPGKGIEKDAPEKRRFFLFFEVFFGKLTKLIGLNFMYFVCLLPLILGVYYSVIVNSLIETPGDILRYPPIVFTPSLLGTVLLALSVFITGPATAGFTYVIRNMQRREHTWIMSDFFEHFKKNFKQGIIMSIIDIAVCMVLYVALMFYLYIMPVDAPEMGTLIPMMGAMFVGAVSIVFLWAHFYIYTMMVTFKLDFGKLFKNSLIFAIAKLPLNILITLFLGLIAGGLIYTLTITGIIAGIFIPVIFFSLTGFITIFSTYPTIDKVMLQKVNKRVLNTRG
ncbi:MAG: YesL family protein [Clostridia bacterium]|nr:YesL family protein [Clostridia bacterium]